MKFFIFSYNRGEYLDNCIESIEHCSPGSNIVIYDDDSTDAHTQSVLLRLGRSHEVVSCNKRTGHKHGGLYANMQKAYESLSGNELFCFLQDDSQLVRKLTSQDMNFLERRFSENLLLGFISPAFVRGISRQKKGAGRFRFDEQQGLFFLEDASRSAGSHYSDILVSHAGRLREHDWSFLAGESANQQQAMAMFDKMGYLPLPFAMWLPYGRAYRGKRRTLALKLAEKRRRCGFYPFYYMADEKETRLRTSCPPAIPIAEQYLENINPKLKQPWIYNPLQGSAWLKHFHNIEAFFLRG